MRTFFKIIASVALHCLFLLLAFGAILSGETGALTSGAMTKQFGYVLFAWACIWFARWYWRQAAPLVRNDVETFKRIRSRRQQPKTGDRDHV